MVLVKRLLLFIALFQIALSPAGAVTWSRDDQLKLSQYRQFLEPQGYRVQLHNSEKKALVYDRNNQMVLEIPFAEQSHLRKFSPKALNQMMMDEMIKVKNANSASWSHSVRNLPSESAMFFMAMGAVMAGQLITNYAQNPVAMDQHLHHSLSPLGVFGFFTFMYTQGVTANVLSMYLKNPKFHHIIPYLGMTVGAFTQTYLSSIVSDPNVKACGKLMLGMSLSEKEKEMGIDENACEKSYEYLVLNKKIWEFAPGIASMLISGVLAAVGQQVVTKVVHQLTGVNIALWLVPGSMQMKGMRLLLVKGMQITAFVAIDMWLHHHIVSAWKNVFDGKEFDKINQNLVQSLNPLMQGTPGSEKSAREHLDYFQKKMNDWRMMNLAQVYEAHHNWTEAIKQLTQMHNTSEQFYSDVVSEIRNSRFNESEFKALEHIFPFVGVPAKDLGKDKDDLYYLRAPFVESMQADTVKDSALSLQAQLKSPEARYLLPQEREFLTSFVNKALSGDRIKMGQSLVELNSEIRRLSQSLSDSYTYRDWVFALKNSLGNPQGQMEPGRGYLNVYRNAPSNRELFDGLNYYRQVGQIHTPTTTDFLLMQMVCGPDVEKNEKSVRTSTGFKSIFLPPTIGQSSHRLTICDRVSSGRNMSHAFTMPIYDYDGSVKSEKGVISYLLSHARPQVVGSKDQSGFRSWWRLYTEKQMMEAFENFQEKYDDIVVKLTEILHKQGKRILNRGEIDNGAIQSSRQELFVYMSILESLKNKASSIHFGFESILQRQMSPEAQLVIAEYEKIVDLLKRIQVVRVSGKDRVSSDLENYELEDQLSSLQSTLQDYSNYLGVGEDDSLKRVTLTEDQREIAVLILEKIQALGMETMMYGTIANAVTWSKIRDIKRINMEQEKFNNAIQEKLNALRGIFIGSAK